MDQWHNIMRRALKFGECREDRTGVGTMALFGEMITFDNMDSFPAVTTKQLAFEQVKAELACFLRGYDHLDDYHELGCKIWDANGTASYWNPRWPGDLGRIYGVQWRDWRFVDRERGVRQLDQIDTLVKNLIKNPFSRRHVVTAFNPGEMDQMCLPPCHLMFQCYVSNTKRLDMVVYMRSVDLFLGLPFDIASYALLQRILAQDTGLTSGYLTFHLGDAHVYLNHMDQAMEVISRRPLDQPQIELNEATTWATFKPSDANLMHYQHHGPVKAPMNV